MRRLVLITVLMALACPAYGVDDPHGSAASIHCGQCHVTHSTLGDILINSTDTLVATLCISCHTPGGWAGMTMYMSSSEIADPGVSGTSHAWNVQAVNDSLGAAMPTSQVLLDHLTADNSITCATCHDPHNNTDPPFLRLDNSADALCLDCHAGRNVSSVKTYTGSVLSHPVGVALPAGDTWHNPPLDVDGNPQPSDGNTSNDFTFPGGNMSCTSCHGVHGTDSNSGTVD